MYWRILSVGMIIFVFIALCFCVSGFAFNMVPYDYTSPYIPSPSQGSDTYFQTLVTNSWHLSTPNWYANLKAFMNGYTNDRFDMPEIGYVSEIGLMSNVSVGGNILNVLINIANVFITALNGIIVALNWILNIIDKMVEVFIFVYDIFKWILGLSRIDMLEQYGSLAVS